MSPEKEEHFCAFAAAVWTRLEHGERTYRDATFDRPLPEILEELRQEILDQAAYAFIALERLAAVEEMARRAEGGPSPIVVVRRPARRSETETPTNGASVTVDINAKKPDPEGKPS
jgi:hypothetical protein